MQSIRWRRQNNRLKSKASYPALAAAVLGVVSAARAATDYWDGASNGLWGTNTNWATTLAGGTDPATAPGSGDAAVFSISSITQGRTIALNADQAALSLEFVTTAGATTLSGGNANRALTLGTGGITVDSGAGAVTLLGTTNKTVTLKLNGSQSWANNNSAALSINGPVTNVANLAPYTLTFNGSGSGGTTVAGNITDGGLIGTLALISNAAGTTTLSGTNSYSGTTTVSSAILQFSRQVSLYNNNTGSWTATNLVVNSGATAAFNVGGAGEFSAANIGTLASLGTASGGFTSGSFIGLDTTSGSFTQNVAINAANSNVGLAKLGTGTLILSVANSYSGTTTVMGGALNAADGVGLPAASNLSLNGGVWEQGTDFARPAGTVAGQVQLAGVSGFSCSNASGVRVAVGSIASPAALTWGSGSFSPSELVLNDASAAGPLTFLNNINLNSAARVVDVNANSATLSGVLSTSGLNALTKKGSGTLVLSGNNTFTGALTVSGGALSAASLNSVSTDVAKGTTHSANSNLGAPTTAAGGTIHLGSGTVAGTLIYTGFGETTDRIIDANGTSGNAIIDQSGSGLLKFTSNLTATATGTGNRLLVLQGSTSGAGELAGGIVNSSNGTTGLQKTGTGKWTLSGSSSYTGPTTVDGGTLELGAGGAINAGSSVAVNNNGILAGVGTVNGTLTVAAGGKVSPGGGAGSIGTLVVGLTTLGSNAGSLVFDVGAAAGNSDKINIISGLTLSNLGFHDFSFNGPGTFTFGADYRNAYTLIHSNAPINPASLNAADLTGIISGRPASLSVVGNDLVVTVIPEPSTISMLLSVAGTGLLCSRRRQAVKA